ncbi:MAG: ribonuclease H-like domain-containing protein, partial [Acidobacteria bacterium]|nr:ribonuclease H-like domain-containing protein [Acidobacteriota bacterium]
VPTIPSSQSPALSPQPPAPVTPTVVTYNGRGFDLPVMETRYLMHRLASPFAALDHLDLLFAARRLWRRRLARAGSDRRALLSGIVPEAGDRASCALTVLEEDVLGLMREGDVPGWEIPGRYFAYTRTGDASALEAVLEHNRLDLVSLGALTGVVLELLSGRREAGDRYELLALGRLYDAVGCDGDAERCFRGAAAAGGLFEAALDAAARAEALHWLALRHRRARRFADAAACWADLLALPGLDPRLRREALEAMAVHNEHRARDLAAARRFALRALDLAPGGRRQEDLAHRLGRLSRKIAAAGPAAADPAAGPQVARDMFTPPPNAAS